MTNYTYFLPLRKELNLTPEFIKGLGDHLFNQLDKTPGINIKYLIIEETHRGRGILHILLESDIPRPTLLEIIHRIKLYTPISLTTKKITPSITPIFSKYKGDKLSKDTNKQNDKLSKDNKEDFSLEELETRDQLDKQMEYLAFKKKLPNTLHYYTNKHKPQ